MDRGPSGVVDQARNVFGPGVQGIKDTGGDLNRLNNMGSAAKPLHPKQARIFQRTYNVGASARFQLNWRPALSLAFSNDIAYDAAVPLVCELILTGPGKVRGLRLW
jgi:hypothetical protein